MNKKVISSVFEHVASISESQVAIEHLASSITYFALNRHANTIAHCVTNNTTSERVIGIFIEESIDYVAAVLGIAKAGKVFMPLDANQPLERLKYMVDVAKPGAYITTSELMPSLLSFLKAKELCHEKSAIIIVSDWGTNSTGVYSAASETVLRKFYPARNPDVTIDGDDELYLLFTSGSTGKPKGIVGRHKSLSHFIHWEKDEFKVTSGVRVSLLAPTTFDVSLRDIFLPLLSGGTLCIPPRSYKENVALLADWIQASAVNHVHMVPSIFRLFTEELKTNSALRDNIKLELRNILLAGEALYGRDVLEWRDVMGSSTELTNLYGPTETTLAKLFNRLGNEPVLSEGIIPLGKPITNTIVLVINDVGRLCGFGETGEIYIKTPFMTLGYYKNDELNKERFIQNPVHNDFKDIVYRTGDLGKVLIDGKIAFVGRVDDQIKVQGNRVELLEIVDWIAAYRGIRQVVIIPIEETNKEIVLRCYYTADRPIDEPELIYHAVQYLPVYMQPSVYLQVENIPLTVNGKVNKDALKKIIPKSGKLNPCTDTEHALHAIWKDLLNKDEFNTDQSFFSLGGSSLKGIKLIARLHREMKVTLRIGELFLHPTIRELAEFIDRSRKQGENTVVSIGTMPSFEVSDAQRRLWILDQINVNKAAYNILCNHVLMGPLHIAFFEQALRHLVDRHEILRTVFTDNDGHPQQKILSPDEFGYKMRTIDFLNEPDWERKTFLLMQAEAHAEFDLLHGPLIRTTLIQIDRDKFIFLLSMHHIIADAGSLVIILNEVSQLYNALVNRLPNPLKPLTFHYKDYAQHQINRLTSSGDNSNERYWLDMFSGTLPVLELPTDFERPQFFTFRGEMIDFTLPANIHDGMKSLTNQSDSSLFQGMLTSVYTLINKWTNRSDVILGTPLSGRDDSQLKDQIGFYVNTLAIRNHVGRKDSFHSLLERVRKRFVEAMDHSGYPFDLLIEKLNLDRDPGRAPLFNIMVVYQNIDHKEDFSSLQDVSVEPYAVERSYSKFDLTFNFVEAHGTILLSIEYNTDLFTRPHIERLFDSYSVLLQDMIKNPASPIETLRFPDPKPAHNRSISNLVKAFEEQVSKTPEADAVVFRGKKLSYDTLNSAANKVAHYLLELGLKPNDVVAIASERSFELIIGMIGIIKAGASYMPVDIRNPDERIDQILKNSSAALFLTSGAGPKNHNARVPSVKIADLVNTDLPVQNLEVLVAADDLMYVLFTSGSTGIPKGAMVSRASFANLVHWYREVLQLSGSDRVLLMSPVSFDLSQKNIFATLLTGASLVLPSEGVLDYQELSKIIESYQITTVNCAPAAFYPLLGEGSEYDFAMLKSLRHVVLGGENINVHALSGWRNSVYCNAAFINSYGPTECTDVVSYHLLIDEDFISGKVPIGVALPNIHLVALDAHLRPVPDGNEGELYIGGLCVGKGYIQNKELTAKSFISLPEFQGATYYRTGDLVKKLSDGKFLFIGRADDQLKINGYRIETDEITGLLLKLPYIRQACVTAWPEPGSEKQLVAYVVSSKSKPDQALTSYLSLFLPNYMIPSHFVVLDGLPLNTHGKIDKTKLPVPGLPRIRSQSVCEPKNQMHENVKKLWVEILNHDDIGIADNFFDVGGNSLKLITLQRKLSRGFNKEISVPDLFKYNTIESICGYLTGKEHSKSNEGIEV